MAVIRPVFFHSCMWGASRFDRVDHWVGVFLSKHESDPELREYLSRNARDVFRVALFFYCFASPPFGATWTHWRENNYKARKYMLKNMLAAGLLAPSVKHKHYVATKKAAKLLFVCKNGFMLDYHHMEEEITGMTAIKVKKDPFAAIDAKFM